MQERKTDCKNNRIYVLMGVSGVGKSTVGILLAKELKIPFFDGDDYHPDENVLKMKQGVALNDGDRKGWLEVLHNLAKEQLAKEGAVIACSALKDSYRTKLSIGIAPFIKWIHITGSYELILNRLGGRRGHFMTSDLLQSQFDTLERPVNALELSCENTPGELVESVITYYKTHAEFGLYGLGVMGKSLSRNLSTKGVKMSLYNRHVDHIEEDVALKHKNAFSVFQDALAFDSTKEFVASLEKPRKVFFMVKAGALIDAIIEELLPYLEEGDILMDGGNSHYQDTERRGAYLQKNGIHYLGVGVSGGEEGALNGPSVMPGGDKIVYSHVKEYLELIAAKDADQNPCCTYIGPEGAGHFVKMVHNGIEYAEMQLIAEFYGFLKASGKKNDEIASVFDIWNNQSSSFLMEATITILKKKENNTWLLEQILDKAENKGTGNWATVVASELGYPATLIAQALFARYISSKKAERVEFEHIYGKGNPAEVVLDMDQLYASYRFAQIINHHQGFELLACASITYNWQLNLTEIARIWTNGCIVKSTLLSDLIPVIENSKSIIQSPVIIEQMKEYYKSAKRAMMLCIEHEIAVPCLSAAVQYFNFCKTADSSANLIQAQRDFFGAHTYRKKNDPTNTHYHTNWK